MKKILLFAVCTLMLLVCTSCADNTTKTEQPSTTSGTVQTKSLDELTQNTVAITIELQDGRNMNAVLYPDLAPKTVENFLKLIDEDFFSGLIFHRVIPEFMIQGGGMDKDMTEKEAEEIMGEFDINGFKNPLKHERGVLSMARTNVPDSASSQFFIMHKDSPHLDGQYAAFGKISDEESLKVVDEIANVPTTSVGIHQDVPSEPIIIKTIKRAQ